MVFIITFSFLNQTLWCDPHWNRLSETIPMNGHTIGIGWDIRKLAFWIPLILDLICCPGCISCNVFKAIQSQHFTFLQEAVFQFISVVVLWLNSVVSTSCFIGDFKGDLLTGFHTRYLVVKGFNFKMFWACFEVHNYVLFDC